MSDLNPSQEVAVLRDLVEARLLIRQGLDLLPTIMRTTSLQGEDFNKFYDAISLLSSLNQKVTEDYMKQFNKIAIQLENAK